MARFEEFWRVMCDYRDYLWLGVMLMLFYFFLALISLVLVEWGTASFWIAVTNMAMVLAVGGSMVWMYRTCVEREEQYY